MKGGMATMIGLAAMPIGLVFVGLIIAKPRIGLWSMFVFSFFANGITRYIDGPFGLGGRYYSADNSIRIAFQNEGRSGIARH
ncbi:MAG: hypothetical protein IPM91_11965 [Bacteroidetes bacterium]|nr:hypothetical protein [Bacteroidota bacterium]